jgi:hypothetical protein
MTDNSTNNVEEQLKQMGVSDPQEAETMVSQEKLNPPDIKRLMERLGQEHDLLHDEGRLDIYVKVMEDNLPKDIFDNAPAVDLGSGVGVHPIEYGKKLRHTLNWYPTESSRERLKELQGAMKYFIDTDNDGPILAKDLNGMALYKNDKVKLAGLSKEGFNGRKGIILGADEDSKDGRLGVKLETKNDPISLKPMNITGGGLKYDEAVQIEEDRDALKEMHKKTLEVDVERLDTWENLKGVHGKCAVVMCTSFQSNQDDQDNTESSKAQPSWRKCMALASVLLAPNGLLLQYDSISGGDYGEEKIMKEHVASLSLDLELVERSEPIESENDKTGPMVLLLWRRGKQTAC